MLLVYDQDKIIETDTLDVFIEKCVQTINVNKMKNDLSLYIVKNPLCLYLVDNSIFRDLNKRGSVKINMSKTNNISKFDMENLLDILEDELDDNLCSWCEFDSFDLDPFNSNLAKVLL